MILQLYVFFLFCIVRQNSKCQAKVDVVFLLDSSGSIKKFYNKEKQFLKAVASQFNIGKNEARIGVVRFSTRATLSIKLKDFQSADRFNNAVDRIRFKAGWTRTDRALKAAHAMFRTAHGGRRGVKKVVILLTDGESTGPKPFGQARKLRQLGYTIVAIGIGKKIGFNELARITGNRKNVFTVKSFAKLNSQSFIHKVDAAACKEGILNFLARSYLLS